LFTGVFVAKFSVYEVSPYISYSNEEIPWDTERREIEVMPRRRNRSRKSGIAERLLRASVLPCFRDSMCASSGSAQCFKIIPTVGFMPRLRDLSAPLRGLCCLSLVATKLRCDSCLGAFPGVNYAAKSQRQSHGPPTKARWSSTAGCEKQTFAII
jgi:hypothetical protein